MQLVDIGIIIVISLLILGIPLALISFIANEAFLGFRRIIQKNKKDLNSLKWDIQIILISFITISLTINYVYSLQIIFYSSDIIFDKSPYNFINYIFIYPIILLFYWSVLTIINSITILKKKQPIKTAFILDNSQHSKEISKAKQIIKFTRFLLATISFTSYLWIVFGLLALFESGGIAQD